jgi:hypothetical protein
MPCYVPFRFVSASVRVGFRFFRCIFGKQSAERVEEDVRAVLAEVAFNPIASALCSNRPH